MAAQSVKIPVELQLNNIKSQIDELRKALNGVKTGTTAYKNLNNVLQQLERQFTATQVESKKAFSNSGQIEHFSRGIERLGSLAQIFQERLEEVGFKDLNIDLTSFNAATKKVKDLEENISKLKQYKVGDLFKDTDIEKLAARLNIKIDTKTTLEELREDFATIEDELDKQKKDLENELTTIQVKKQNFTKNFGDFADTSGLEKEFKKLADANTKISFLPSEQSNATDKIIKSLGLEKVALPKISKANTIPEYINDVISKIKEGIADYNKGINETIKDAQVTKIKLEKALLKLQELEDKGQKNISGSEAISLTSLFGVRITQDTISKNKKTLNNLLVAEIDKINNQPKLISLDDSAIQTAVIAAANGIKTDANLQAKAFVQAVQNFLQLRDSSINPKVLEMNAGEDVTTYISRIISTLKAEGIELENLQNQIIADIAEKSQLANEASQAVITVNQEIWQQDKTIALEEQELDKAKIALQGVENASRKVGEAINHSAAPAVNNISENIRQEFVPRIGEAQDKLENLRSSAEKLESIQNSIKQWFGFNEVINLTKNAIRGAIEHISKLDDVMTEIAVVTDMTQKELWEQISTYSAMAQKYGATTEGVYEVSQLYYQQGLQTAEVMRLTEETLKMAKIANLEYADATDYMTVALRGFKLEMTDAQRVVDVYSNIAAVTASDTEELAVAMSKTASSAEAVGSSFENTTAMIALMVETTREAPQNIGSAMKSIISRYGEMTSDPTKLVDSEGEEMSLNRVDKALKTVGITLQNTNGQFREFDDVILELSAKWDTIDKNTQRYIATIMAGNRQQSRFLALVGNYERLSELYEEAANSQDAATLQTLKTMDSIETKINQLKTTFQEFYTNTGIEELIKGILDFITKVIEKIDGIPKAFGKIPIAALGMVGSLISTGKNGALLLMRGIFGVIDSVLPEVEVEGIKIGEYLKKGIVKGAEGTGEEVVNKVKLTKTKTNWGIALGSLGMIISSASLALGDLNTQVGRTTSGIFQLGGGFASAFGQILTGNYIGAAITLFSTITSSISTMIETTEEKVDRLKKAMEETSNQTILAKDELKTLEDYRKKLEKLTKERYNSDEAYQEWLDLNNEIVNKYPDLLDYMDNEGNLIAKLGENWEKTKKAKEDYYNAAKAEAVAALNYYGDPNASFSSAGGKNPYPQININSISEHSKLFFNELLSTEIKNLEDFENSYYSFIKKDLTYWTGNNLFGGDLPNDEAEKLTAQYDIFRDTYQNIDPSKNNLDTLSNLLNSNDNKPFENFYQTIFKPMLKSISEGISLEILNQQLMNEHGLKISEDIYNSYKLLLTSTNFQFESFSREVQKAVFTYVDELDNNRDSFSIDTQLQQDFITEPLTESYISWLTTLGENQKESIAKVLGASNWAEIINTGRMGEVFQYWINSYSDYENQILEAFSDDSSLLSIISKLSENKQKELDQIYLNATNYTLDNWLEAIGNILGVENVKKKEENFKEEYNEQTGLLYEEQKNRFNQLESEQGPYITSENLSANSLQQLFNLQETAGFSDELIVRLGKDISNLSSEKQEAFNNILSNANTDLTTLSGYYSFLQQLSEQNIVLDQNTLDQIRSSINPNWAIETELVLKELSTAYSNLEENYSKAAEGLTLDEAIKFGETYGISISDFREQEEKWYLAGQTLEEIGNSMIASTIENIDYIIEEMEADLSNLQEGSFEYNELQVQLEKVKTARDYIPQYIAEEAKSVAAESFYSKLEKEISDAAKILERENEIEKTSLNLKNKLTGLSEKDIVEYATKLGLDINYFIWDALTGTYYFDARHFDKLGNLSQEQQLTYWNSLLDNIKETDYDKYLIATNSLGVPPEFQYLIKDAQNELFESIISSVTSAIGGGASYEEANQLIKEYNLDLSSDFIETADGLKITQDAVLQIYNDLKVTKPLAAQIVLDNLTESIMESEEGLNDIYQVEEKIRKIDEEINNAKTSDSRKKILQDELTLAKNIHKELLAAGDAFNFMEQDLPTGMTNPLSAWEGLGQAFEVIEGEDFKAGYIDYTDLYNMISMMDEAGIDLKNVATNFNGDAVEASELMKAAAAAMVSIDGEVFVDLTKLGETFKLNADGMKEGIADGLEVFAQSQIELLDGQIAFLETIVAQEEIFKNIDINTDSKIDFSELLPSEITGEWSDQQLQVLHLLDEYLKDLVFTTGQTWEQLLADPASFSSLDKASQDLIVTLLEMLNPSTDKVDWTKIVQEIENFVSSYKNEVSNVVQTQASLIEKKIFIPVSTELENGPIRYNRITYENIGAAYQQYLADQEIKTAELPEVQATASQVTVSTKDGEFVFTTSEGEELTVEELIAKLNLDDTAALETLSAVQTALDTLTLPDHVLTFLQQAVTKVKDYASAANSISQLAVDRISKLKDNLNNIPTGTKILKVALQVSSSGGVSVVSVDGTTGAKGNVATVSLAKGNARAKGTLMGELGPELYATGGHYYVAGQNGAEFVDLPDDAIVFNHLQTRRLLENGSINGTGTAVTSEKKAVALATGNTSGPAMASASDALNQLKEIRAMWQSLLNKSAKDLGKKAGGGSGGSGGGGGGSDEDNKAFIHNLERWYNLLRQIEKLEQQITYEQAKRANMQSGYNHVASLEKELVLLKKQQAAHQKLSDLQKDYYDKRRKDLLSTDYSKIFTYDQDGLMQYVDGKDRGLDILATLNATDENGKAIYTLAEQLAYLRKVGFDTKVLETNADGTKAEDEEQMLQNFWDGVDGWMEELDGLYDSYNESMTSVQESIEAQMEIQQEYIDNQLTVEEKLLQAIIDREQAEIDRLEKEKEVLEEATSEYIEGLNNALDREKKMYEKNDTSAETARLQRQLAILQRSGGSAAEIRSLQDQIDSRLQDAYFQEQQDQIDAIQEASNNQLEKMQEQIDIMTEALEYQKENGLLWTEVYEMMNLWTPEQMLQFIEEFTKSYKENSDLQNQEDSEETQKQLEIYKAGEANKERDEVWADFYKNLNYEEEFKNKHAIGAQAAFNEAYAKGGLDEAKKAAEQYYKNNEKPKTPTDNNENPIEPENKPTIESGGSNSGKTESEKRNTKKTSYRRGDSGSIVKKIQEFLNTYGFEEEPLIVDGKFGTATERALKNYQRIKGLTVDGIAGPATLKKMGIITYKTGGLVDFTGPAWVDGTKSKPEAFLSASDTAMLKSKIFSNSDGSLKALVAALEEITNNTSRYSTETNTEQIVIQNAQVNIQPGVISNDYSARRAGEMALEEMVKIARKTTNRVVSR